MKNRSGHRAISLLVGMFWICGAGVSPAHPVSEVFQIAPKEFFRLVEDHYTCRNRLREQGHSLYGTPLDRTEWVTGERFARWKAPDVIRHIGVPTRYRIPGIAEGPQRMVPLRRLPTDDQLLVRMVLKKARLPRYANPEQAQRIEDEIFAVTKARLGQNEWPGGDAGLRETIRRQTGLPFPEVGAWKIVLRNRTKIVAPHTSRDLLQVKNEDLLEAFNGVMRTHGLSLSEITSIDYFHNHPGTKLASLLLSEDDEVISRVFHQYLASHGGAHITHECYAIYQAVDGLVLVSHLAPLSRRMAQ